MAFYLKRVGTVMSLKQLKEDGTAAAAADALLPADELGPTAPVGQVAGAKLPRYSYSTVSDHMPRGSSFSNLMRVVDADDSSSHSSDSAMDVSLAGDATSPAALDDDAITVGSTVGSVLDLAALAEVPQRSLLDTVTLALWEQCAEEGLFRYDVTACPTKVLPGQYGFVAQLNEGRATKKRATEFRMDQVCQPFDEGKFNFKKAYMREVLYQFEPAPASAPEPRFDEHAKANRSPNLVIINVSPIEYGHVLLCPRVLDCLPQLVDVDTAALALRFAREFANPYLRVGYNSFGAFASINHLHFQAYYLAAPLPIERAPTLPLKGIKPPAGVRISRTTDFPVHTFVIEGSDVDAVAQVLGRACVALQRRNVPHNFLVCDSGMRTFLFPQCYAEKLAANAVSEELLDTGINPAVFEIAGHMLIKRAEDYEAFTEALAWRLLEEASLPEDAFLQLAGACFAGGKDAAAAVDAQAALAQPGSVLADAEPVLVAA